jgi:hypothetical protein
MVISVRGPNKAAEVHSATAEALSYASNPGALIFSLLPPPRRGP